MACVRGVWNGLRGLLLLIVLGGIFTGVLLVSCLARLLCGYGASGRAGKLAPGG